MSAALAARIVAALGLGPVVGALPGPSRGAAFVVRTRRDAWFVKLDSGDAGAEARGAELTAALDEPVAPRLLLDRRSGALVSEWLEGWSTLHELFERRAAEEIALAAAAGRMLARVHGVLAPADLAPVPGLIMGLDDLDAEAAADLPGDSLALVAELQSTPGLVEAIAELAGSARDPRLVHGDVKLDNLLAPGDGRAEVRLVDWERCGAGDPMRDLGFLAGDYLFRWLRSAAPRRGTGLPDWFAAATVPRPRAAAAVAASLAGYSEAGGALDTIGLARHAGLYLLGRAFAWLELYGEYSARAHLLVQAGRRLILRPETAVAALL